MFYNHKILIGKICEDQTALFVKIASVARTGRSVGTTQNSPESGRSWVQSQVAASARYGEFSSREKYHGFSPEKH